LQRAAGRDGHAGLCAGLIGGMRSPRRNTSVSISGIVPAREHGRPSLSSKTAARVRPQPLHDAMRRSAIRIKA